MHTTRLGLPVVTRPVLGGIEAASCRSALMQLKRQLSDQQNSHPRPYMRSTRKRLNGR